jgi:hypothetical protein
MDLFLRNLDNKTSREKLREQLDPVLAAFDIHVFDVHKAIGKPFASLLIADPAKAQRVLAHANKNPDFFSSPSGRSATFQLSRNPIDKFRLKALIHEDTSRKSLKAWQKKAADAAKAQATTHASRLIIQTLKCGCWEAKAGSPAFQSYFEVHTSGRFMKTGDDFVIELDDVQGRPFELVIAPSFMHSMAVGMDSGKSTINITLAGAPKFAERTPPDLVEALASLSINSKQPPPNFRVGNLPNQSSLVAGSCFTYCLVLADAYFTPSLLQLVKRMAYRSSINVVQTRNANALPLRDYRIDLSRLSASTTQLKFSYALTFQLHAFIKYGLLSPSEMNQLLPIICQLRNDTGEPILLKSLQRLALSFSPMDATGSTAQAGMNGFKAALQQQSAFLKDEEELAPDLGRAELLIHHVTVTPAGLYPKGPNPTAANRVLRQYRDHAECFLKVEFTDEDFGRIEFDRRYSNTQIYQGRFLSVLQKGLDVAGYHFDFLGYSHSSLRSQTCWFMRAFVHEGTLLFAPALVKKLGDFDGITCPAKCAARIAQAFSETHTAVAINPSIVKIYEDVQLGQYCATYGCGTMSPSTWRLLRGRYNRQDQPTSYQIRYKGAKGMLTLDPRLQGDQVRLRRSMVKFSGSPSNELEICGLNAQPLPFKLNRQLVKILEDLGVPNEAFHKLQDQAIKRLQITASSRAAAIDFIVRNLSDSSSGLPRLLRCLQKLGVDATEDEFLRNLLGALLQIQLRELKYRTRIPVPDAYTLYRISDETGWLPEGQIFVTWFDAEKKNNVCLSGHVAITRSPALHPGDIQVVSAVSPPADSPLWKLRNCVAFSQKGSRDLPSMLSGGDLDGDLYNVIFDDHLIPAMTRDPAAYLPAQAVDIGRPVTTADMTAFFVDFMENDVLGRVASLHQVLADREPLGTLSSNCLLLAELHSTAVDFSKLGIKVEAKRIPRAPPERPDFMCPSASIKVEKGIKRPLTEDDEAPTNGKYRYYASEKVLGELYRAMDEDIFFETLEDDTSSLFSKGATNHVLREVLDWALRYVDKHRMEKWFGKAREVREYYEATMLEIMHGYAVRRTDKLTEREVFIGTILGRSGARSKKQREQSDYMKTRFNGDLRGIKYWMEQQADEEGDEDGYGFLSLAAACLYVAVKEESIIDNTLQSFGWFAAGMCVPDIARDQEGSVFSI